MKDIEIKITKSTRFVDFKTEVIGNDGESLQSKLIFTFKDEFVDGQARLEYEINCEKYYAPLEKIGESYEIPIKSVMTKQGSINMQLVITQGTDENEIPIFKSNKFFLTCNESINAEIEQPEQYPDWIDVANTKLNEIDEAVEQANNLDINATKTDNIATIEVIKKDGEKQFVKIYDGEKGDKGEPNTLTIGEVIRGDEANATITGESPNQVLNLTLPKGDRGEQGIQGEQGVQGPIGPQGPQGIQGEIGPQGPAGKDGTVSFEELTEEQRESLRGPQGIQGEQGPKGEKGDKGDKGDTGNTGATGPSNKLTIGTVTNGTTASATITGTSPNQVLNLVLPRGEKGATGSQGIQGKQGETGQQGAKGDKGDKGDKGEQGIQGIQGEKGEKGDKGDKGDKGEDGITPDLTNYYTKTEVDGLIGDIESILNEVV